MARPAAVTPDAIRATVLALLAEAGDPAPASGTRFRKIVSVRKLRARLGAGDPATLSRHLNAIEAEVVQAGLAGFAVPDVPQEIAAQMRALWEAAVATQLADVMQLRQQAEDVKATAEAARHEAELRTELFRAELADLRAQLSARDDDLLGLRLEGRALQERAQTLESTCTQLRTRLTNAETATTDAVQQHERELAAERVRYEGLSKQLLRETAHQREAFQTERQRLEAELTRAAERLAALESLRERILTELADERAARQQAAAEATALATVVEQQRQTLALMSATMVNTPAAGARRPARSAARSAGPTSPTTKAATGPSTRKPR
ncbi:putative nuclease with TOPRIM domain [Paraburkholderia bannensis]|uniref:Putative nuclease with TOPRIM domain n=1 Tax=Paraburkholderia bannensis TaxID=765414 RepID=A0A7W9WWG1_9BURK|nr:MULTISPECIES: DNA-binding protein [Paraburkholderia]MBB3261879.1 putative nuclease with TOPRIM domain [Paraburkholderia sp. WP4_3_2]MBB6106874.1 putative nuclease with TOPRIM domain [Paraburkholderia bannensis]